MMMSRQYKVLLGCLIILIALVPIGLIATGTAYGEWGADELKEMIGFIPQGFEQLTGLYNAPMPDYDFAGVSDDGGMGVHVPGYYVAAIIGIILGFIILFGIGTLMTRGKSE